MKSVVGAMEKALLHAVLLVEAPSVGLVGDPKRKVAHGELAHWQITLTKCRLNQKSLGCQMLLHSLI